MIRLITIVAMCLGLQACATTSSVPSAEEFFAFSPERSAMLAINSTGRRACGWGQVRLRRIGTAEPILVDTSNGTSRESSDPAIVIVEPGLYTVDGLVCYSNDVTYYFDDLHHWFGVVEVEAGDALYLGALEILELTGMVEGWGLSASLGETEVPIRHHWLVLGENSRDILAELRSTHPYLAASLEHRPLRQIVSHAELTGAVERAYAPDTDGRLPRFEDAQRRMEIEEARLNALAAQRAGQEAARVSSQTQP